ncbi:MAG: bifunctional lysine ketoglutarate reductase /saccharopine dehydrogenase family protein [Bacteroidales bacterium]|nr:bifunctional lysine ketoglutarate reductase /saccharopine dehydrogenase family protein [Bacteroidales bacterium]
MSRSIGIRHEDKYPTERRASLTPAHVSRLVSQHQLDVVVERSAQRYFTDEEYRAAGARLVDRAVDSHVVFGVKEMPVSYFELGKTYVFFSHVIKGQAYNMPMLARMMELKCTLIDYERIVDEQNRRLIFFGRFAGLAGTINTFWALGQRLRHLGFSTPFQDMKQARSYASLEEARKALSGIGNQIVLNGLPAGLAPLVVGVTGSGNVAKGIHELIHHLPVMEIDPGNLKSLFDRELHPSNILYKVVFRQHHLVKPNDPKRNFDLQHYYAHPDQYQSRFEEWLPYLTVLFNGMYWDERFPKIVTRDALNRLTGQGQTPVRLKVIGDITCDPGGSVEATVEAASVEKPCYVYDPANHTITHGFAGKGVQVMAVDILPSELPRESSEAFGDALLPFVRQISSADYSESYEDLDLPRSVKKGVIVLRGELTPSYKYLEKFL